MEATRNSQHCMWLYAAEKTNTEVWDDFFFPPLVVMKRDENKRVRLLCAFIFTFFP